MAIKPSFLKKYAMRYDTAMSIPEIQAGFVDRILKEAQEDIDDQFSRVLQINGDNAIINLFGPMSENGPDWIDLYYGYNGVSYKNLIRAAEEILKNDAIKNVIVNGNTPGGNIDGLDEAFKSLDFLAQKRPVTAINKGMIASAGVWYASAAHKIIAGNPSSMIGSIGVVIDTLDFTGYYNSFGIEQITITNTDSPNKRPNLLTEEGKNIYIKELNSLYSVFLDRATDGKTVTPESIKALKGEMIIAADAVKIGLMDSIEGVQAPAADAAGSDEDKTAKIQTEKELTMDADVKEALEKITTSVSAVAGQVAAMAKPDEEKKGLSDEDKTFALNIANGDIYPDAVKKEAVKALAGKTEMSAFKSTITVFDAIKEQNAGPAAEIDPESGKETVPTGKIPGGDKKEATGEVNTESEAQAELDRIKGEV